MKKLLLIVLLIVGCSEQIREEIIERFPTGEKMIVAKYKGEGNEEQMVEKTTYLQSGTKLHYENFVENYEKGFTELNDLNQSNILKEYLQGKWEGTIIHHEGTLHESKTNIVFDWGIDFLDFDENKVAIIYQDSLRALATGIGANGSKGEMHQTFNPISINELSLNGIVIESGKVDTLNNILLKRITLDSLLKNKKGEEEKLNKEEYSYFGYEESQGKDIYYRNACNACHSVDGSLKIGGTMKNLYGKEIVHTDGSVAIVDEKYIRESLLEPNKHIREGYTPIMPSYKAVFSDTDINNLIAYIKYLK